MSDRLTFVVIYEHDCPVKAFEMSHPCKACGAIPYPTPSGKINVRWLRPVEADDDA